MRIAVIIIVKTHIQIKKKKQRLIRFIKYPVNVMVYSKEKTKIQKHHLYDSEIST